MKRSKFSEEQGAYALQQVETGTLAWRVNTCQNGRGQAL